MFDRAMAYDIIYALAARDGREGTLFGYNAPLAHDAFERSYSGRGFPELWFELPLIGDPWFDLHIATAREDVEPGMRFDPATTGGYPEVFEWFSKAERVRQLFLSYDLHTGSIDHPPIQLLVRDPNMHEPFLALAGGDGAAAAWRAFRSRIPKDWFPCYTGVFATRATMGARAECIPSRELRRAYVKDDSLLESHLRQIGRTDLNDEMLAWCQKLTPEPFQVEFQFDVLEDGTLGPTFSASARLPAPINNDGKIAFGPDTPEAKLMLELERLGLADDRWRLLEQTAYAKTIARDGTKVTVATYPAFLKIKWRSGELVDAKAYLISCIS